MISSNTQEEGTSEEVFNNLTTINTASSSVASNTNEPTSLITSVESMEEVSTSRLNTSQIPHLLLQSSTSSSDNHLSSVVEDEEPFEISVIGNSGVIAIALKDKHEYIHCDIVPSLTKTLNKLFRLTKSKPKLNKYSKLYGLWEQFKEWFGTNAWEVFLFRLFDCLIVMAVMFCMRRILPSSVSRLLEWFIDPVDEGFPYSQQEQ